MPISRSAAGSLDAACSSATMNEVVRPFVDFGGEVGPWSSTFREYSVLLYGTYEGCGDVSAARVVHAVPTRHDHRLITDDLCGYS